MKNRYYIIWVEGLSPRNGEKVKTLTNTGVDYTTLMTAAMRVRDNDITDIKHYLNRHGIKNATFRLTSYAPKGTLLSLKHFVN